MIVQHAQLEYTIQKTVKYFDIVQVIFVPLKKLNSKNANTAIASYIYNSV